MEKSVKSIVEKKAEYEKVAKKLCDLGRTANKNMDSAVELFGTNATEIRDTFQDACVLLYECVNFLNKKLEETVINL